jgi:hypothetical protein
LSHWDVPAPLRAFLRQVWERQQLTTKLGGNSDIHEPDVVAGTGQFEDVIASRPDGGVRITGGVVLPLWSRHVFGDLPALVDPLLATPVHQLYLRVTVDFHLPERIGHEPVIVVPIEHDRGPWTDAGLTQECCHLIPVEDITTQGVV